MDGENRNPRNPAVEDTPAENVVIVAGLSGRASGRHYAQLRALTIREAR